MSLHVGREGMGEGGTPLDNEDQTVSARRVNRGNNRVSNFNTNTAGNTNTNNGWRPVLG